MNIDLLLSYYITIAWYMFNYGTFWEKYFTSLAAYVIGIYLTYTNWFWRGMLYWQFALVSAMFDEPVVMLMLIPDIPQIIGKIDILVR